MKKWEYTECSVAVHGNTKYVTQNYGEEGWELVTVVPFQKADGFRGMECIFFFKREIEEVKVPSKENE